MLKSIYRKAFMTRLSVNVNKIATLRNSRGKNQPHLMEAVEKLIHFGVKGITVHPRPDGRHILYTDVREIKQFLKKHTRVEMNVEGYPSSDFLQLIEEVKPQQCTLVPDPPTALTSNAGWTVQENFHFLKKVLLSLKKNKIRSSLFIDPFTLTEKELSFLNLLKTDRVELYTEAYATAYGSPKQNTVTQVYMESAQKITQLGIGLNAGHDLNLNNLGWILKKIPQIKEVSIGHALICESLYRGLETVVKEYLAICNS